MLINLVDAVKARLSTKATSPQPYYDQTLPTGETMGRRSDAASLVARFAGLPAHYAYFNATNCARHQLRMFRPAKSARRAITERGRKAYLRDATRIYAKAATWAETAGDVEEVTTHPILDLLRKPNPNQTSTEFAVQNFLAWEITGKRFTFVVETGRGVEMLLPMTPQHVRIQPGTDRLIDAYWYGAEGNSPVPFEFEEVIYRRFRPSPFDPFDGLGPMRLAMMQVDIYNSAETSELAGWKHGARPDYAITTPPEQSLTEPQRATLRASINAEHRGPQNRGKFLILPGGLTLEPLQFSPKEMEYLAGKADLRNFFREVWGIPQSMAELNDANLASAEVSETQYSKHTILPRLNNDAEGWTEDLFPRFGLEPGKDGWLAYDDPVPKQREALRLDIQAFYGKVWTKNECRAELGFDAVEGGDEFPEPVDPFGLGGFGGGGFGEGDKPKKPEPDDKEDTNKPAEDEQEAAAAKRTRLPLRRKDDDDIASALTRGQRTAAARMEEAVTAWFRRAGGDGLDVSEGGRVTLGASTEELYQTIRPLMGEFLRAGMQRAGQQLGVAANLDVTPVSAIAWLDRYSLDLVGGIDQTTRDSLRNVLKETLASGATLTEQRAAIAVSLNDQAGYRAERIARTESARAYNAGNVTQWKESGVVNGAKYLISAEPCPQCIAEAAKWEGQTVPLDRAMDLLPLHPNCRCTVIPIVSGGEGA